LQAQGSPTASVERRVCCVGAVMFKGNTSKVHQVKGTVVLMSKNALDFNKDGATAIFSPDFSIKLISSNMVDGLFLPFLI